MPCACCCIFSSWSNSQQGISNVQGKGSQTWSAGNSLLDIGYSILPPQKLPTPFSPGASPGGLGCNFKSVCEYAGAWVCEKIRTTFPLTHSHTHKPTHRFTQHHLGSPRASLPTTSVFQTETWMTEKSCRELAVPTVSVEAIRTSPFVSFVLFVVNALPPSRRSLGSLCSLW